MLVGQYSYNFIGNVLCTVEPQVTTVLAEYSGNIINSTVDDSFPTFDGGWAGWLTSVNIYSLIGTTAGLTRNPVGDLLSSIYYSRPSRDQNTDLMLRIVESYIRGVVEFGASVIRLGLSQPSSPLNGTLPRNMTKPVNGTLITTTYGWDSSTGLGAAILLPVTALALASILVVILAWWWEKKSGRELQKSQANFDPGNTFHLMAAVSADKMANIVTLVDGRLTQPVNKVKFCEGDIALVKADF